MTNGAEQAGLNLGRYPVSQDQALSSTNVQLGFVSDDVGFHYKMSELI